MDYTLYWFMFPTAIVVATTSIMSGIGGAALFTPIFLIIFPMLGAGYPLESAIAAIGAALLTQTFGFASGFFGYWRKGLIDYRTALPFIAVAVPIAVAGALVAHRVDGTALKGAYALLMGVLAAVMLRRSGATAPVLSAWGAEAEAGAKEAMRTITDRRGQSYSFPVPRQGLGAIATSIGAFLTGLVSVGIGETIMPQLVKRNRVPVAVAAATSVLIVIATVAAASLTQIWGLIATGGITAVPWNLVCYTVPGVLIGGQLGPLLQGRVSQTAMVRAIGIVFVVIGLAMAWVVSAELGLRT
jgi:uncharacterized membrane protein YfcA